MSWLLFLAVVVCAAMIFPIIRSMIRDERRAKASVLPKPVEVSPLWAAPFAVEVHDAEVSVIEQEISSMAVYLTAEPADELLSELGRRATQHKRDKNWTAAIECLAMQRTRAQHLDVRLSVDTLLRLPLFLQQAGRFDDAMAEFERLLDQVEDLTTWDLGEKTTPARQAYWAAIGRGKIYDKIRVAAKREKHQDLVDEYAGLCNSEHEITAALLVVVQKEWELERGEYQKRIAERERTPSLL